MKKQLAIVLTVALMSLPVSSTAAFADELTATATVTATAAQSASSTDQTATDQTTVDQTTTTDQSTTDQTSTDQSTVDQTTTDQTSDQTSTDQTTTDQNTDEQDSSVVDGDQTVDPGTLPDSPFYWLTSLIEKIQLALTFDPAKKADLAQHQALKKLAAAQALMEKGEEEAVEEALNDYSKKVQQAQSFLEKFQDPNSEEYQTLEKALAQTNAANIQVLGSLLDKLPPQAAQRVALNIVRSMEKAVKKLDKEQQKKFREGLQTTTDSIVTDNLDEQAKAALASFQESLGLKASKGKGEESKSQIAKERQKGKRGAAQKIKNGQMVNQEQDNEDEDLNEQTNNQVQQQVREQDKDREHEQDNEMDQDDDSEDNMQQAMPSSQYGNAGNRGKSVNKDR